MVLLRLFTVTLFTLMAGMSTASVAQQALPDPAPPEFLVLHDTSKGVSAAYVGGTKIGEFAGADFAEISGAFRATEMSETDDAQSGKPQRPKLPPVDPTPKPTPRPMVTMGWLEAEPVDPSWPDFNPGEVMLYQRDNITFPDRLTEVNFQAMTAGVF